MQTTFTATLKNQLSEIAKLEKILEEFGLNQQIPDKTLLAMNLALEEILTNIISYGYQDTQEHDIFLRLTIEGKDFMAEVEDDGIPFNPLDSQDPDITLPVQDRPIGGLGIHLTKKMMDGIDYERREGKNFLRLKKSIPNSN